MCGSRCLANSWGSMCIWRVEGSIHGEVVSRWAVTLDRTLEGTGGTA